MQNQKVWRLKRFCGRIICTAVLNTTFTNETVFLALRAINARHNPTQETLNRLLKPFKLKLSLAPIEQPKRRHAA